MKISKKLGYVALAALIILPIAASAQITNGNLTVFQNMANSVKNIVNTLLPVVFGLGVLAFFWGLVKYLFGDEHDKDQAKKTMLWGVVAIFVMASIWGLVRFIGNAFGVSTDTGAPTVGTIVPTI